MTQEQAIATAMQEVDFTPKGTQVRLLRQGLNRHPFWIVSLSVPNGRRPGTFRRLALVHIDANTGTVTEVEQNEVPPAKDS